MPARPYRGIHPKLAPGVYIDPAAVVIGDVELGADASVFIAVIRQAARADKVVDAAADPVDKRHFGPAERAEAGKKRGGHGRQSAARTRAQDRMPL